MIVGSACRFQALVYAVVLITLLLAFRLWRDSSTAVGWSNQDYIDPSNPNPAIKITPLEHTQSDTSTATPSQSGDDELPCRNLPGAEDVVVIMRTGATEIQDKLPRHFETTFRCYSDLIIFSDYAETFMGHDVHDVLKDMNRDVMTENEDFDIYLRLLEGGRASLDGSELSGKLSFEGSKSGKLENAGWRLDKWKFLPMMRQVINLRPNKKWYLFVESDSYVVWSNLLKYLENMDSDRDIYYGSEVQIGDDLFAHGGSAFIMTRSAIEKGALWYEEDPERWHDWTARHWAGDCVLGKCLLEAGVELGWAWPMFQGGHPEKMDFTEWKGEVRVWCSPILSFHHFADEELQRIWQFEQDWITVFDKNTHDDPDDMRWALWKHRSQDNPIMHGFDVFKDFVFPNLTDHRTGWNNFSPMPVSGTDGYTAEDCRNMCVVDHECVQYLHRDEYGCNTGSYAMLGEPMEGATSGWLLDRIDTWMTELDQCGEWVSGWSIT